MPISLGTTTIAALYLGTTSITSAYLGNTQVFGGSFTPLSLYSSGSQGVWYDPSDLTTMFVDRAGTTPVTAPGQLVGLRLDKSKGLELGPELVVNGDFAADTNWAKGAGWAISGGVAAATSAASGSSVSQDVGLVAGRFYRLTLTIGSVSAGGIRPYAGSGGSYGTTISAAGTYSWTLLASGNSTIFIATAGTTTLTIDNISVRELPGNHATAPTDAARPMYGVEPKGGRRNTLLWSEGFDNAVWTKRSSTATAGVITATAGAGDHDVTQTVSAMTGNITFSVKAKAGTSNFVWLCLSPVFGLSNYATAVADLTTGAVTKTQANGTVSITGSSVSPVDSNGFYRIALSVSSGGSNITAIVGIASSATPTIGTGYGDVAFTAAGTETIQVKEAQLELGSTATAYQRVTIAEDVTEAGVPTCHYCRYDGANNSMSTSAIDFTATDKMSVFAGVRKNSDTVSVVAELSPSINDNSRSFLFLSGTNNVTGFEFTSRGSAVAALGTTGRYAISAPTTVVFTGIGDISAPLARVRINGVVGTDGTSTQGTGNFGNYPLFIGRRNNASLPFNGRDFGIIIVGKAASGTEITDTETWLAAKTSGVTL